MNNIQNNQVMPYQLTIGEVIKDAWARVKGAKLTYWLAIFTYLIPLFIFSFLMSFMDPLNPYHHFIQFVTKLAGFLIFFPMGIGVIYLGIRRAGDLFIQVKQIFETYHYYWPLLGTLVLNYIIISLTVMLLMSIAALTVGFGFGADKFSSPVIPILLFLCAFIVILYITLALSFAPYLVVEKKFGVFQSIATSFKGFAQHGIKIVIIYVLVTLLVMISAIPLGIGLIWSIPFIINITGVLYRTIFGIEQTT